MRFPRTRLGLLVALLGAMAACPGGGGQVGEPCEVGGDCDAALQCVAGACLPRCVRAPDCGDGFSCDADGLCLTASGKAGDACASEVDCVAGLACQLDGDITAGSLGASCAPELSGRPAGDACVRDGDCRDGTCALGRCVDLCRDTLDCSYGAVCTVVPRVEATGALFQACLPGRGALAWTLPVGAPSAELLLPVPGNARSISLTMVVDDVTQRVGATQVLTPHGEPIYALPLTVDDYFTNRLRHQPALGQSVLAMPPTPTLALETGAYRVSLSSLRASGAPGSATPRATAVVQLGATGVLDLHLHFLDLSDHPCAGALGGALSASAASAPGPFQALYLRDLRATLSSAGIAVGQLTYDDLLDHPDLDGLDAADAPALLALGTATTGIDVFFVRTLSPTGLQALGPAPGPALPGTRDSGVVIAVDTLCYRSWTQLARLTAHELARYLGLSNNVEAGQDHHPSWQDPIEDSDTSSDNLMYYSELGGTALSDGQREILSRSPALR
jgi:hypothetical protein